MARQTIKVPNTISGRQMASLRGRAQRADKMPLLSPEGIRRMQRSNLQRSKAASN